MRTFAELRRSEHLHHVRDTELGAEYWMADGGPRVRVFEHVGAAGMAAYVMLHEYAHLWIHGDYDHDAWLVLDVDEPIEVGVDFVVMPRRIGNTLDSFVREEDRAEPPPRLADLRALIPKLVAAAVTPADRWSRPWSRTGSPGPISTRSSSGPSSGSTSRTWRPRGRSSKPGA